MSTGFTQAGFTAFAGGTPTSAVANTGSTFITGGNGGAHPVDEVPQMTFEQITQALGKDVIENKIAKGNSTFWEKTIVHKELIQNGTDAPGYKALGFALTTEGQPKAMKKAELVAFMKSECFLDGIGGTDLERGLRISSKKPKKGSKNPSVTHQFNAKGTKTLYYVDADASKSKVAWILGISRDDNGQPIQDGEPKQVKKSKANPDLGTRTKITYKYHDEHSEYADMAPKRSANSSGKVAEVDAVTSYTALINADPVMRQQLLAMLANKNANQATAQ